MNRAQLPLVAGNWKMNKGPAEARAFVQDLAKSAVRNLPTADSSAQAEIAVFPPLVALPAVADVLKGTTIAYGGQNCHWAPNGAFTGETAAGFLAELGCKYVLVGHSERRTLFGETDDTFARKFYWLGLKR